MLAAIVLAACFAPALAQTAPTAAAAPESKPELPGSNRDAHVRVADTTLHYEGIITAAGLARFRQALSAHPEVTAVQVRSRGGDALPAIEMGGEILRRKLAVVVDRVCNSACASYLFTPAPARRVLPGSMVVWHNSCPQNVPQDTAFERILIGDVPNLTGSMTRHGAPLSQAEIEAEIHRRGPELRETLRRYYRDAARQHKRLFSRTGIDDRIDCLTDYLPAPPKIQAYYLSGADMATLGVCNVELPADYEAGVADLLVQEGLADRAGLLRLADYPGFVPSPRAACPAPKPVQ